MQTQYNYGQFNFNADERKTQAPTIQPLQIA